MTLFAAACTNVPFPKVRDINAVVILSERGLKTPFSSMQPYFFNKTSGEFFLDSSSQLRKYVFFSLSVGTT